MSVTVKIGTLSVEGPLDQAALKRAVERAVRQQFATPPPGTAAHPRPGEPGFAPALTERIARSIQR